MFDIHYEDKRDGNQSGRRSHGIERIESSIEAMAEVDALHKTGDAGGPCAAAVGGLNSLLSFACHDLPVAGAQDRWAQTGGPTRPLHYRGLQEAGGFGAD